MVFLGLLLSICGLVLQVGSLLNLKPGVLDWTCWLQVLGVLLMLSGAVFAVRGSIENSKAKLHG